MGTTHDWYRTVSRYILPILDHRLTIFLGCSSCSSGLGRRYDVLTSVSDQCLTGHLNQRLEDQFDGANRRNLRHFILTDSTYKKETLSLSPDGAYSSSIDANDLGEDQEGDPSYYFLTSQTTREDHDKPESIMEERMDLARIPTCAIFHKLTSGKGVPHTFIGELRCYFSP